MARERDYAYEALAEATNTDMDASRGELNVALKTIRQMADLEDATLAVEIHRRARGYRQMMGDGVLLTPTALAKHWHRVVAEVERKPAVTNASTAPTDCQTCGGDRFVVVGTRPVVASPWMDEHKIVPPKDAAEEEVAPCPDCNPVEVSWYRPDGSHRTLPDPDRVRQMMAQ